MSGLGKRFKDVGYTLPKPLIRVEGEPIISHVIDMFPKESDFIFICNKDHLITTDMKFILLELAPDAQIIPIDTHDKGPVYATSLVFSSIKDDEEVLVSYCDYAMELDINEMLTKVREGNFVGAVPSYTGFHPHLIHKKLYGGILTDGNGVMIDYREKHSFTEDPMKSHHSAGAYYFRTGREFKEYSEELLSSNVAINGEKYTSMLYYLYHRDGKKIYVPEVSRFMQWGAPEDLEEYEAWSRYIHKKLGEEKGKTDIPESRERYVKIPYDQDSEEFKNSEAYWTDYFTNI